MAVIVAGKLYIKAGRRDEFVGKSQVAVRTARQTDGCHDFAVSPDPIDPDRVNIYEAWRSEKELTAFRGSGAEDDTFELVESFDVNEYTVHEYQHLSTEETDGGQ